MALIDMLASTGIRVGELVLLNRDDINIEMISSLRSENVSCSVKAAKNGWCTSMHGLRFICRTTCRNALMIIRRCSYHFGLHMRGCRSVGFSGGFGNSERSWILRRCIRISSDAHLLRWRLIKECRLNSCRSCLAISESIRRFNMRW